VALVLPAITRHHQETIGYQGCQFPPRTPPAPGGRCPLHLCEVRSERSAFGASIAYGIVLKDLDLTVDRNAPPRKYPAPPTGHELMAMFPPAPPVTFHTGPTSGFFQKEERAFFAQAGKEIVRVRIEVDLKEGEGDNRATQQRPREGAAHQIPRPWPSGNAPPHPQLHPPPQLSPSDGSPAPFSQPTHTGRTPRPAPVGITPQPAYPMSSQHSPQPPFPPNTHPSPNPPHGFPLRTLSHAERPHPPTDGNETLHDEFRDDPDEAWRRPTPHNQRRRAGKHTKRVVVK
jgi:hypothetical protein